MTVSTSKHPTLRRWTWAHRGRRARSTSAIELEHDCAVAAVATHPSDLRIVIPTSNGYQAALAATLGLLDRYWAEHPPVDVVHHDVVFTDARVRPFFAGPQATTSWCEALALYLDESTEDELMLLLLDDYALCRQAE